MKTNKAWMLALGAAALSFTATNTAFATEGDEIAIETPVDVVDPVESVDPVDVKIDDPIDLTRGGDDGIIGENERTLDTPGNLDNPDVIFYTMADGGDMADSAAETAAEQAAQQAADRVADKVEEQAAAAIPAEPR